MTFNKYFDTDFVTYNKNGVDAFIAMLESKGFELKRKDWFQCGGHSSVKYTYKTLGKYVSFSFGNDDRIEVGNYNVG